jgi:predicted RNA-binding protein (TIGR00451 family)
LKENDLIKLRAIADYQFGRGAGKRLFPKSVRVVRSRRTGRMRYIYLKDQLLATLKPTTGTFVPTVQGFQRLLKGFKPPRLRVVVQGDVASLIEAGHTVFTKHVINADPEIRPGEEVAVASEGNYRLLAVGRAVLSGPEMLAFERGPAVKVRRGVLEKRM